MANKPQQNTVTPGTVVVKAKPKPSRATQGNNLQNPGYGETAFADNSGVFFGPGKAEKYNEKTGQIYEKPGVGEKTAGGVAADMRKGQQGDSAGQQYWEGVSGRYQDGGPSYTQDAYNQFGANVDPNLDQYYDAAFKRTQQRLDRSAASRGMYGSSYAMQNVNDAAVQLGADQANREADYALRRQMALQQAAQGASQDELGWVQGMGGLAFGAGQEGLQYGAAAVDAAATGQQLEQDRVAQGYNAAMGIDQFQTGAAATGIQLGGMAQGLREGRIQGAFDNQLALGDRYAAGYGGALAQDAEAANEQIATEMGMSTEEYNRKMAATQAAYQEWLAGMSTVAGAANPVSSATKNTAPTGSGNNNKKEP